MSYEDGIRAGIERRMNAGHNPKPGDVHFVEPSNKVDKRAALIAARAKAQDLYNRLRELDLGTTQQINAQCIINAINEQIGAMVEAE